MAKPIVKIVWDNQSMVAHLPEEMGVPRPDQLQGSELDKLAEIAGRVCYDSVGKGRSSEEYHEHIREVRHHSVLRHGTLVFEFDLDDMDRGDVGECLGAFVSRPGVQVLTVDSRLLFSVNQQAALEWNNRTTPYPEANVMTCAIGLLVARQFKKLAPLSMPEIKDTMELGQICNRMKNFRVAAPFASSDIYVSLFISNVSRNFTHELVRHGWDCAVSQRSTRYCDEDKTPWIMHPMMRMGDPGEVDWMERQIVPVMNNARATYNGLKKTLEKIAVDSGMATDRARKQARGAARGVLGGALGTELIFTASLEQWRHMFDNRCTKQADMEMEEVMTLSRDVITERFPNP